MTHLKVTLAAGHQRDDISVVADGTASVGDLVARITASRRRPEGPEVGRLGVMVNPGTAAERLAGPETTLAEAGVRSGDVISLVPTSPFLVSEEPAVATLHVINGPGAPASFPLRRGLNVLGRDHSCDVRLPDPLVSKRHARISITDMVELRDEGSANGIVVSGQVIERVVLHPGDTAVLGESTIAVTLHTAGAADLTPTRAAVAFNRSPRLDPRFPGVELDGPEPPQPPEPYRFPISAVLAPILMAGLIYAITKSTISILFVALSPMLLIGSYVENRITTKQALARATERFREAVQRLAAQLEHAADLERISRQRQHPSAAEVLNAAAELSPLLWTRRPEHDSFLQLRLGLGTRPSRSSVKLPSANRAEPEPWSELTEVVGRFTMIDGVPVVADLRQAGNVGVAGPGVVAAELMRGVLVQLVGLHSPAELVLAGLASAHAVDWEWLKWVPHVGSEFSPLKCGHLAANTAEAAVLVAAIEALIEDRAAVRKAEDAPRLPVVIVFVHDDAPIERSRLVQIAERGPAQGVHVAWLAANPARLPAACRAFLDVDPNTMHGRAALVLEGHAVTDLVVEPVDSQAIDRFARRLAPVVDAGAQLDDQRDLPREVAFMSLAGNELADSPPAVVERWRESNSLPPAPGAPRRTRDNSLRALVGQGASDHFFVDLRAHGPHALVGGTTGAGKSEFLQSWILGMATTHSPSRVSFLFVDYKGGAAFADCVQLPHSVGLVTDLTPHLVRRALTSLNAELRHREHLLNSKKAKDLLELERRNDPDTPASLVIVVDEFAALVAEVPEFVDGVVNVAQRGRSLGLHLILATQRPAGVIKENLRANTNLRIALRMADEADSSDVIGAPDAAAFDPELPGRAVAKTGPGRLIPFQSAYSGGWTSRNAPLANVEIQALRFGTGETWEQPAVEEPSDAPTEANDIGRIVATVRRAALDASIRPPRRPWLPELAPAYRLEELPTERTDRRLVFGVLDDPVGQLQPEVAFEPDRDGNMAVYGTGGSGKSTFLRSIAVAAALAPARGGPCWIYGLDFGARGLSMLEALPHVGSVVNGDDSERVTRLVRWLRAKIDERAQRYAGVNAATVQDYREYSGDRAEARIVVLVDGIAQFRTTYEMASLGGTWDVFQTVAADGRGVGVHVIVSADRPAAVPTTLGSMIQRRLVLRLGDSNDYASLGVPSDVLDAVSPAGRGLLDGHEVQVAVIGGDANVAVQAAELSRLAASMSRAGVVEAPAIERLEPVISRSTMPADIAGDPVLGVSDETLEPVGFEAAGTFVVAGPARSGRTTVLASMLRSLERARPEMAIYGFADRRSTLGSVVDWSALVDGTSDEAITLAAKLAEELTSTPERVGVVIEAIGDLAATPNEPLIADVVRVARRFGHLVLVEGDTDACKGYGTLAAEMRIGASGIVLQPDEYDGEALFKTPFPRIRRAEFPPGRGLFVHRGRLARVQVPLPE